MAIALVDFVPAYPWPATLEMPSVVARKKNCSVGTREKKNSVYKLNVTRLRKIKVDYQCCGRGGARSPPLLLLMNDKLFRAQFVKLYEGHPL